MSKKTNKKVTKVQEEELDLEDELDLDLDLDLDDDLDLEEDEEEVEADEDDLDLDDEDLDLDDEDDEDEDEEEEADEEEDEDDLDLDLDDEDLDLDDEDDEDEEEDDEDLDDEDEEVKPAPKKTSKAKPAPKAKAKTEKPVKKLAVQKGIEADLDDLYGEVQAVLDLRDEQIESGEGIPRSVTISNELLFQIIAGELSNNEGQFKAAFKRILVRMGLGSEASDLLEDFNFTKNDVADIFPSVVEGVRKVLFMGAGVKMYATPQGSLTLKGNIKEERIVEPKFDHVKLHTKIGSFVAVTSSSPAPTAVKQQGKMVKGKFVPVEAEKKTTTKKATTTKKTTAKKTSKKK